MRKSFIRTAIAAIVLTGTLFLLISTASNGKKSTCKESLDECCKKKEVQAGKKSWEHLSGQFFSSI